MAIKPKPMTEDELKREAEAAEEIWKGRKRIFKVAKAAIRKQAKEREAERAAARKPTIPVLLRLSLEDMANARTIAERKGLPYQTFLKSIIHEGLEREKH